MAKSTKPRNKKRKQPNRPEREPGPRKPRILWANTYCLLDLSSGASMTINETLKQLSQNGFEVQIIGATIFDSENGATRLAGHIDTIRQSKGKVVNLNFGSLTHQLVKTSSTQRKNMKSSEENTWYALYTNALDTFKPDIVYFYGGSSFDFLIPDEAHARGIPSVAYVANGNFQGVRWCRDVDLILTNGHATASMYRETVGFSATPVGVFIDPASVIAEKHERRNVLMVNPSYAKGAAVAIALAVILEKRRPDIHFEVVESRGNWESLVKAVTGTFGNARTELGNVTVTPNTNNMSYVYSRARILLALSLWWEAFGRVAAEAMMNAIPAVVTQRGGLPEVVEDGGITVQLPESCYSPPYKQIPNKEILEKLAATIERFYDDEQFYKDYAVRAAAQGGKHHISKSTERFIEAITPLLEQKAGDRQAVKRPNKQVPEQ